MSAVKYSENRHALKRGADCSGRAIKPIALALQVNPAILLLAKSFPLWNFSPRGNFPWGDSRKNQGFSPTRNVRFSLCDIGDCAPFLPAACVDRRRPKRNNYLVAERLKSEKGNHSTTRKIMKTLKPFTHVGQIPRFGARVR